MLSQNVKKIFNVITDEMSQQINSHYIECHKSLNVKTYERSQKNCLTKH